ncbi:MAG: Spo0B domain-containing protein [Bacillota bacterium]|nr:Spo0B domain-containing protein [Bacillota bacterium]MDW7683302.1 Spo0B domain-containing protein [Bacillota bacterium]
MHNVNEAMEKLVSIYRHDFLNVLQVIGGLAQLNKTDRLLTYIRKASEEVQQFGRLVGCGDPRLAFSLYEILLQDLTGSYLLQIKGSLPLLDESVLHSTAVLLQDIQKALLSLEDCTLSVTINGEKPELKLQFLSDHDLGSFWPHVQTAAKSSSLHIDLNRDKSELTILLDNPDSAGENKADRISGVV